MSEVVESIEELDAQIKALEDRKAIALKATYDDDLAKCKALIKKHGFSKSELGFVGKSASAKASTPKAPGVKVPAGTYADPKNPDKKWNAHGRKPQWFIDALADGKTMEQMLVK